MENLVNIKNLFGGIYTGRKVVVTGHTGFKGSWLVYWLEQMGAQVFAFSLPPSTHPNHFTLLDSRIVTREGDVRHSESLHKFFAETQPEIIFHLAAQALVRRSYSDPVETFSTNVMGSLNVFEAARSCPSVRAIINITSDKCYENREWIWGYRETDAMGGYDPYSASKGCAELLTASYRNSFFPVSEYLKKHHVLMATARAGNVIGGGDWAEDRLIPDLVRAASIDIPVKIRNPKATRPWQHVLEPLSAYLLLGQKLLEGDSAYAEGWNFGPDAASNVSVSEIYQLATRFWPQIAAIFSKNPDDHHEANFLMLDCSKASRILNWHPVWNIETTIGRTINWYRAWYESNKLLTNNDLQAYILDAKKLNRIWTI